MKIIRDSTCCYVPPCFMFVRDMTRTQTRYNTCEEVQNCMFCSKVEISKCIKLIGLRWAGHMVRKGDILVEICFSHCHWIVGGEEGQQMI